MKFQKYNSIVNTFRGDELDYIRITHAEELKDVTWNVYEKIHGANFSMWYDGETLKTAKRSGWAEPNFFNSQSVVEKYTANVKALYALLKKPCVVYGEIFGGMYDGIKSDAHTKQIQTEVKYCPHNDFAVFDIATINDDSSLTYLNEAEFQDTAFAAGFFTAPFLGEYKTLDEAIAVDVDFTTLVPHRWALVKLEKNFAEGVVIKPSVPLFMYDNKRIIFKKKVSCFKEAKSVVVPSSTTDEFLAFFEQVKNNITVNRMTNVFSHLGEGQEARIYFTEFMKDCIDDCDKVVYNSFSELQKKLLLNLSAKYAWPIIREVAYKKDAA